jgi:hypothetical protein
MLGKSPHSSRLCSFLLFQRQSTVQTCANEAVQVLLQHPGAPVYHRKHSSRLAEAASRQAASVAVPPPKRPHNWAQPARSVVSAVTRAAAAAAATRIQSDKSSCKSSVRGATWPSPACRTHAQGVGFRGSDDQAWRHCCGREVKGAKLISTCRQLLAQGLVPPPLLLRERKHVPPRSERPAQER